MKSTPTPRFIRSFLTAFLLLLTVGVAQAQKADVDKATGLVKVDGNDAFYLKRINMGMDASNFSLQNLNGKELAYLKFTTFPVYRDGRSTTDDGYTMVFTESGNQCTLTGFSILFGTIKPMARQIVAANLVQNGSISPNEERKFVALNNGRLVAPAAAPAPMPVIAPAPENNSTPRNIPAADISLKNTNIYNHGELVGTFKQLEQDGNTVISIYNKSDALIARATHEKGNDSADWNLAWNGSSSTILYNTDAPLQKLFKYLAERGAL